MGGFGWALLPLLAATLLAASHSYLGLHILRRKVIFVDLALAQIAALGTTYAFLIGVDPASSTAYFFSLVFTILGAAVFSLTRMKGERVPQEAIIGIAYVVAGATAIVLIDAADDPHGAEHIKKLLSGNIVWVTWAEVWRTGLLYLLVGGFHIALRRKFMRISSDPDAAQAEGMNVRFWDFLFYVSFGLVITASVRIAGVLLVFSYLVVPAVFAFLFAEGFWRRLTFAFGFAMIVSTVGVLLSYDRPMGPTIVTVFGVGLVVTALGRFLWKTEDRAQKWRTLGYVASLVMCVGGLAAFGLSQTHEGERHVEHGDHIDHVDHSDDDAHVDHGDHASGTSSTGDDDLDAAASSTGDDDLDALIDDADSEAGD